MKNSIVSIINLLFYSINLLKNSRFIKTSPDCSKRVENKKSINMSTESKWTRFERFFAFFKKLMNFSNFEKFKSVLKNKI